MPRTLPRSARHALFRWRQLRLQNPHDGVLTSVTPRARRVQHGVRRTMVVTDRPRDRRAVGPVAIQRRQGRGGRESAAAGSIRSKADPPRRGEAMVTLRAHHCRDPLLTSPDAPKLAEVVATNAPVAS